MKTARRLRSWLVALLILVPAVSAGAAILTAQHGVFYACSSGCATGAGPDFLLPAGAQSLSVGVTGTGTFVGAVDLCLESAPATCTANGTWFTLATLNTSGTMLSVDEPGGFLRLNVTTCTACTFRFIYRYVFPVIR